jgi:hypothetical protein
MALTKVDTGSTSSGTAATAPKGINVQVQGTAQATMYTVPTGRRFKGHLWTNNQSYYGMINSAQMYTGYTSSYYYLTPLPIELGEGDVVKASPTGSDYTMLQGIEFDA